MNYEQLKLANQLCFPLYAASKAVVAKYTPHLSEIGLTYTQYITMMVLWEHTPVGVKELGEHLSLDSGTLTPLLKRLESKGLVRRERPGSDERTVIVTVTEAGTALKRHAALIPQKMAPCMPLSKDEAGTLYALLYKLLDEMRNT
ncbi:MAG: MarR family transcriptional regulator [Clostridiales Family XIII bacterium]|jgi:DNA-binding MarR family transcriptional regulator|nr:MarR family transcriptional regulator [Clostridiales Family XIII bacterium]